MTVQFRNKMAGQRSGCTRLTSWFVFNLGFHTFLPQLCRPSLLVISASKMVAAVEGLVMRDYLQRLHTHVQYACRHIVKAAVNRSVSTLIVHLLVLYKVICPLQGVMYDLSKVFLNMISPPHTALYHMLLQTSCLAVVEHKLIFIILLCTYVHVVCVFSYCSIAHVCICTVISTYICTVICYMYVYR